MRPSLQKLISTARKAPRRNAAALNEQAPFGFATRVAAQWAAESERANIANVWKRLCWWGATASLLVCLSSAVYRATLPEPTAFDSLLEEPALEGDLF